MREKLNWAARKRAKSVASARKLVVFVASLGFFGTIAAAQGVWLDVPYVHQEKDGCGAAAISMVMQYWAKAANAPAGSVADAETIQREIFSKKDEGISASAMESYFKHSGYSVYTFDGEWRDLAEHVNKGRPLIVCVKPGKHAPLHYTVVAGVDDEGGYAFLNDPAERKLLRVSRADFEHEWNEAGRWTLLALPADKK